MHRQLQAIVGEHRAMAGDLELVRLAAVIEPRLDLDRKPHDPADHPDVPNQPVSLSRPGPRHRHEVADLADPVRSHESRHQDPGVRQVQPTADVVVPVRRNPVVTAAFGIEQRSEHTR